MLAMQTIEAMRVEKIDVPMPEPGPGEIVIKMEAAGICAGDVQIFHGKHKYARFPLVQGHEGVGAIHSVGPGVNLRVGDRVVVQQQLACGECVQCKKGRHNFCTSMKGLIGVLADGLFCQYFRCPAWNAMPIPADFSTDKGMLVEPASVAVHAVRVAKVTPEDKVVVIGAGVIGNFVAQACRAVGAKNVLVADIAEAKLAIAAKNGIPKTVNSAAHDLDAASREYFGGDLADVVFDCAGVEASIKQALAVTANCGRTVIVANFKAPVTFDIPSFQRREVSIVSVMGSIKSSTEEAISFLASDAITIHDLISARYPLERIMDAYSYIDNNAATVVKVALTMQ